MGGIATPGPEKVQKTAGFPNGAARMATVSKEQVLDVLKSVKDPGSGKDIVSGGMVTGLQTKDGHVAFAVEVDPEKGAQMEPLRKQAEKAVYAINGVISATVVLTAERKGGQGGAAPQLRQAQQGHGHAHGQGHGKAQPAILPGVKSIVAVASGKG